MIHELRDFSTSCRQLLSVGRPDTFGANAQIHDSRSRSRSTKLKCDDQQDLCQKSFISEYN